MKNLVSCLITSIVLLLSNYVDAQFYIKGSVEYAIPALKELVGNNNYVQQSLTGRTSFERGVYHSYGDGISPCIAVGMQLGKHFSTELGYSHLFGAEKSFTSYYAGPYSGNKSYAHTTFSVQMNRVQPGIRFSFDKKKFGFYNSLRMIIGFGGELSENEIYITKDAQTTNLEEIEWKEYGGISMGFANALGVNYNTGNFGIFMEANLICQSWAPKKAKLTKLEYNGVDQLPGRPVAWMETEFVNSAFEPSMDLSKPSQKIKHYLPLSSAGISIGITYNFGKHEVSESQTVNPIPHSVE